MGEPARTDGLSPAGYSTNDFSSGEPVLKDGHSLAGYSTNEFSSGVPAHPSLKFLPDSFAPINPKIISHRIRAPPQTASVPLEAVSPSSQGIEPNLAPSAPAGERPAGGCRPSSQGMAPSAPGSERPASACKRPVPHLVAAAGASAVSEGEECPDGLSEGGERLDGLVGIAMSEGGERSDGLVGILQKPQVDRDELTWGEFLGDGVTAEVFKGRWRDRDVAIKRLRFKKQRALQTKQEVAFVREIGVVAQANHDNLVKFFGFHFDAQPFLLITEFCHGGTCFELLHEADLELVIDQQLKMCSDVASGMDYLHKFRPQIIHRDLKSLNLLLAQVVSTTSDVPHVKVADFGVARMKDEDGDWGEMTAAAGSYHWMAPEVVTGHYDEKADVYSFAMVLFEIICQEIPFEELEANDVIKRTSKGARPDMEAVPPTTPDALVEIMEQSWAQDSKARPSFETICRTLGTIVREIYA